MTHDPRLAQTYRLSPSFPTRSNSLASPSLSATAGKASVGPRHLSSSTSLNNSRVGLVGREIL